MRTGLGNKMWRISYLALACIGSAGLLTAQAVTEFPLPQGSTPASITAGSDGNLWYTDYTQSRIGRMTPAGVVTTFATTTPNTGPSGIASYSSGGLYFTERTANRISFISTGGSVSTAQTLDPNAQPVGIVTGPDFAIWFTEYGTNKIARLDPDISFVEYTIPTPNSQPLNIIVGSDGALWFTESGANKIGRITTAGVITEFTIPTSNAVPTGITSGPDGEIWFTQPGNNKIGRLTMTGVFSEYSIPTPSSRPTAITTGNDYTLYFVETDANKIGRITHLGVVDDEFPIPTANSQPGSITNALGYLWFSEYAGARIGRLAPRPLTLTSTCPIPVANLNTPYSYQIRAIGGVPQYGFSLTQGNLPPGLVLDGASGVISGTPTTPGTYPFTIRVIDNADGLSESPSANANFSCSIAVATALTVTATCPALAGTVGVPYSFPVTATGGQTPLLWTLQGGAMPPGLILNAETGVISGIPTTPGSYPITVRVSDSLSQSAGGPQTATYSCAIVVTATTQLTLTAPCPATGGVENVPYSFTVSVTGGRAPLVWSLTNGTLPPGLSLNTANGLISGTPTTAGTYPISVTVRDTVPVGVANGAAQTVVYTCNIVIAPRLSITSACPTNLTVGVPFTYSITATGGQGTRTYLLSSGPLPPGLSLNQQTGVISGTPTATGSFPIIIRVADSSGSANFICTLVVVPVTQISLTARCPAAPAMQGVPFSFPITVSGGTPPINWSFNSQVPAPSWLSLNSTTGVLSGIPTAPGIFPVSVTISSPSETFAPITYNCNIGVSAPFSTTEWYFLVDQGTIYTMSPNGSILSQFAVVPGAFGRPVPDADGTVFVNRTAVSGGAAAIMRAFPNNSFATFFTGPLVSPVALAKDSSGNLIVGDNSTDSIYRVARDGSSSTLIARLPVLSPSEAQHISIAVDAAGNYIVSTDEFEQGKIYSITPAGAVTPILTSGLGQITGLVYRPSTDDFVVTTISNGVLVVVRRNGTFTDLTNSSLLCCALTDTALDPVTGDLISALQASVVRTNSTGASAALRSGSPLSNLTGIAIAAPPLAVMPTSLLFTSNNGVMPPPQNISTFSLQPYSIEAIASVTTPPNGTWLAAAILPPGTGGPSVQVTANPTGLTPGTYNGTVRIVSTGPVQGSYTVPVVFQVNAGGLTSTTACPLPTSRPGFPISVRLTATGGTGNYTFNVLGLPSTMSVVNGSIVGTSPYGLGFYPFTIQVSDGSQTATQQCGISVIPAQTVVITGGCPASPATVGTFYSASLQASGGDVNWSWSGNVPPGLRLTGSTINGVPATPGTFTYVLQASNGDQAATLNCSLTVNPAPLSLVTGCPGNGRVGTPYGPFGLGASGGVGNYSFSLASGSLPAGVSLTGSSISGNPTTAGSSTFRIQVTSGTQTATGEACTVAIAPGPLSVSGVCPANPGIAGTPLSPIAVSATGGQPPYQFTLNSANADFLSLSSTGGTASVTGTPTLPGTFGFSVTVSDGAQSTPQTFSCSLNVNPAPLSLTGTCPTSPVQPNSPISVALGAVGGRTPYAWSIGGNSGLSLSSATGATSSVTGNAPANPGNYNFNVTLSDGGGSTPATLSCPLTVQVPPLSITGTCPASSLNLPVSLSVPLTATGGRAPYNWAITAPSWITLSSASGASTTVGSTGTPPSSGPFSFTVTLSDGANTSPATLTCNSAINPPAIPPVTITGLTLTGGLFNPVTAALQLGGPAPLPLTGIVRLSFTPNAFGPTDNPEVTFNGRPPTDAGRQFPFTIAAGQQSVTLPGIQPGTVAGTIRLELIELKEGARDVLTNPHPFAELVIPRQAPVLNDVTFQNETQNGFEVLITGFATSRELINVTIGFVARQGTTLETTSLTRDVTDLFRQFYTNATGSSFRLIVPVTVDGNKNDIGAVTVNVTSSVGASNQIQKSR